MSVKSHIPKLRSKLLLILLALALTITAISFIQSPLTTYAEEGNGDGADNNDDLNENKNKGYPSYSRTGWLVYLVNSDGELKSKVAFVSANSDMSALKHDATYLTSKIGGVSPSVVYPNAEWGAPFTDARKGRGKIIKDELTNGTDYSGGDRSNAYWVVENYLGLEALRLFKDEPLDHYLVLETVAWHKMFTGSLKDTYVVASASGFGKLESDTGVKIENGKHGGDAHTGWCDNECLQTSCYLNLNWPGLPTPPTEIRRVSPEEIASAGYGLIAVRGMEDVQSTYDESLGDTPGNPPDESDGVYTIVKNYRTHNLTDDTYTDDGCFSQSLVSNQILVEDEISYKVVEWKITGTTSTNIPSVPWNPPTGSTINNGELSGKMPGMVTIKAPNKCLYVLLEKIEEEEEEALDANYIISQSSITRRIHLSKPDAQLSMPKIQDHTFTWILGAHQTSCSGHTWYCGGCEDNSCNCTLAEGESCTKDHGKHCDGHTEYCSNFDWHDRTLKLSITNTQKNNYPDILSTKDAWRAETEQNGLNKFYYRNNTTFNRDSTSAVVYTNSGWDYVCVIHRGKDKLTVADWKNSSLVKGDLGDVSGSGYAVANTLQGTRKLVDFYDKLQNFNRLKRII